MFSGSNKTERQVGLVSDVRECWKPKMKAINRKYICKNVYLILYIRWQRDSKGYYIFSWSSKTVGLVWLLSDVDMTSKSKMASINRKYICNNGNLSLYITYQQDFQGNRHVFGIQFCSVSYRNTHLYLQFHILRGRARLGALYPQLTATYCCLLNRPRKDGSLNQAICAKLELNLETCINEHAFKLMHYPTELSAWADSGALYKDYNTHGASRADYL
jgi:hypothetical protein